MNIMIQRIVPTMAKCTLLLISLGVVLGPAWDIAPVLKVPQEFPTIQAAVNAAPEGAIILIAPGDYRENVTISKSLTLQGAGRDKTSVSGQEELKPKPVFFIENSSEIEVILKDLTLSEGYLQGISIRGKATVKLNNLAVFSNRGSGIWAEGSGQLVLQDSIVSGNERAGLMVIGFNAQIMESEISMNGGPGIRTITGAHSQLRVIKSTISGNKQGGLWLGLDSVVVIQESWISDNGKCGIGYEQLFTSKNGSPLGYSNWVQYNAEDLCNVSLPQGFLLSQPPKPLLDAAAVCPSGCTFTKLGPAVWAVRSGGAIYISPGVFLGTIVLAKNLTLQGAGRKETIIRGYTHTDTGILVVGQAHVVLLDIQVLHGGIRGVEVSDTARVYLQNLAVSGNIYGISATDSAQIDLQNAEISDNRVGLALAPGSSARANVSESVIYHNFGEGIYVGGRSQLNLINSHIFANGIGGLSMDESASAKIQQSRLEDNGTDLACEQAGSRCSAVLLSGEIHLQLAEVTIRNNADWGLAALLRQCGYDEGIFAGKVIFEGNNVIEGNNKLGKLNGMGNPGNHPFKNLPDGQVCLP